MHAGETADVSAVCGWREGSSAADESERVKKAQERPVEREEPPAVLRNKAAPVRERRWITGEFRADGAAGAPSGESQTMSGRQRGCLTRSYFLGPGGDGGR
ncbi:hypothetical protein GN956_G20494 [Arapaima gigas]